MSEPEPIWVKSKWKVEEINDQTVEFRLVLKSGGTASGFGKFWATSLPPIDDLLSIQIVVEELLAPSKVRQTVFQISQMAAGNIELNPNHDVARFRLFV